MFIIVCKNQQKLRKDLKVMYCSEKNCKKNIYKLTIYSITSVKKLNFVLHCCDCPSTKRFLKKTLSSSFTINSC